ncbi:hypothetical protein M5K25_017328 [Dendrobium thyrsiflorum]|uniref:Uncharacterized protein n=1 Tax=Dendrobium thyrsiflorum TaxID=117978 RepID=A0ABD0UMP1_DENTH
MGTPGSGESRYPLWLIVYIISSALPLCGCTLYILTRQQDPFGDPQISGDHGGTGIPSLVPSLSSSFLFHSILFILSEDSFSFLTQESEFSSLMFGRHIRLVNIRSFLSTLYSLFRFGQVNVEFPLSFLFALLFRFGQASIDSSHSPFRFGQVDIELFSFVVFEFGQTDVEFPPSGWVPDRVPGGHTSPPLHSPYFYFLLGGC